MAYKQIWSFSVLLITLCLHPYMAQGRECGGDWEHWQPDGRARQLCYKDFRNMSRDDAKDECKRNGAYLVTIANHTEALALRNFMTSNNLNEIWVGLSKKHNLMLDCRSNLTCRRRLNWEWDDDKTPYDNSQQFYWVDREPKHDDAEWCATFGRKKNGMFMEKCSTKQHFICQRDTKGNGHHTTETDSDLTNENTSTSTSDINNASPDDITRASATITTVQDDITTASDAITTALDDITTGPDDITTASDAITTAPDDITTASDAITTAPDDETTASDAITTAPDDESTASDAITTAPDDITTAPHEWTGEEWSNREDWYKESCSPNYCQNGATCRPDEHAELAYVCICRHGFDGTVCEMGLDMVVYTYATIKFLIPYEYALADSRNRQTRRFKGRVIKEISRHVRKVYKNALFVNVVNFRKGSVVPVFEIGSMTNKKLFNEEEIKTLIWNALKSAVADRQIGGMTVDADSIEILSVNLETDECISTLKPCNDGGECKDGDGTFTCDCLPQYKGNYCEDRSEVIKGYKITSDGQSKGNRVMDHHSVSVMATTCIVFNLILMC